MVLEVMIFLLENSQLISTLKYQSYFNGTPILMFP